MTELSTVELSREDFLSWMAKVSDGVPTLPGKTRGSQDGEGRVTLTSDQGTPEAWPIVLVPEHELADFFAFVGTYVSTFRPYSAFFRVLPRELFSAVEARHKGGARLSPRLARLVAGASLSEAFVQLASQAERSPALLSTLQGTLSAALGQAILCGYPTEAHDWVAREWVSLRRLSGRRDGSEEPKDALLPWQLVSDAAESRTSPATEIEQTISALLRRAFHEGGINGDSLRAVSMDLPAVGDLAKVLASSREERISRFNEVIRELKERGATRLQDEFTAGLLLAIAGNGSFDLLRSARQFEGWLPGAAIWFGICAALFQESNVLTYANCAGRRLSRDVQREDHLFGLPTGDIGSIELKMLASDQTAVTRVGAHGGDWIDVEILPGVVSRVAVRGENAGGRDAEQTAMLMRSLQEIGYIADRAQHALGSSAREPKQRDLYSKGRARSR